MAAGRELEPELEPEPEPEASSARLRFDVPGPPLGQPPAPRTQQPDPPGDYLAATLDALALGTDPEGLARREELRLRIEQVLLRSCWDADAKLHLFGSSVSGLGTRDSDVDLCMEGGWQRGPATVAAEGALRAAGYATAVAIRTAKVPIVKFTDPQTGLHCDLCFNNMLAVHNSRLLLTYTRIEPRVRLLALAVKHWAKSRAVVGTRDGYLSSYALSLLVVFYGQQHKLLPCLTKHVAESIGTKPASRDCNITSGLPPQDPTAGGASLLRADLGGDAEATAESGGGSEAASIRTIMSPERLAEVEPQFVVCRGRLCDHSFAEPTAAEIAAFTRHTAAMYGSAEPSVDLLRFFHFVLQLFAARTSMARRDVVCVRQARLISREEAWSVSGRNAKSLLNSKGNPKKPSGLSIQDPFDLTHDVGCPLRGAGERRFVTELQRAAQTLAAAGGDSEAQRMFIDRVCDATDLRARVTADGWIAPKKPARVKTKKSTVHGLTGGHRYQSDTKYQCPECGERFQKWTLCLGHIKDTLHADFDPDNKKGLQQRCMVYSMSA